MSRLIYEFMEDSARKYPDVDAIRWMNKKEVLSITYKDLLEAENQVRRGLIKEGYRDTHICIMGVTSPEWLEAYLGIVTGKNTAIPLDLAMPGDELYSLIDRADATGVFVDKSFKERYVEIFDSCPQVKKIWFLDGVPEGVRDDRVSDLAALIEAGKGSSEDILSDPDDIAMIIFTSGTTGKSKGVMLTQKNVADNVNEQIVEKGTGIPMLNVLPVHHAFCLVMDWLRGFANAAIICINDSLMHLVRSMTIFNPVTTLMVPLMIETLYKRVKNADPSIPKKVLHDKIFGTNLIHIYSGGAHLDPFYVEKFAELGITILEGYGMSECSPCISANMPRAYKVGSVGKPLKNVEIKFEDGEICVRGSSVMKEYYNMPEETSETLKDGWLHTGDKGYLDEDGFLFINGRIKNLIILSNGENVSPEEIENKLALEELVGEVIIAGENNGLTAHIYPDPEVVAAGNLSDEDVRAGLQAILDKHNSTQPSYRHIVGLVVRKNPFVKSATKKIKRQEIHRDEP